MAVWSLCQKEGILYWREGEMKIRLEIDLEGKEKIILQEIAVIIRDELQLRGMRVKRLSIAEVKK